MNNISLSYTSFSKSFALMLGLSLMLSCTGTDQAVKNEANILMEDFSQFQAELTQIEGIINRGRNACDRVSMAAGAPALDSLPEPQFRDTLRYDSDSLFNAYDNICNQMGSLQGQASRLDRQFLQTRRSFNIYYRKVYDNNIKTSNARIWGREYLKSLEAFQQSLTLIRSRFAETAQNHNRVLEQIANSGPQFLGVGSERIDETVR